MTLDAMERPHSLDNMRADFWKWLRPHLQKHRAGVMPGDILTAWKKRRGELLISGKEDTRVRYIIRKLVSDGALRRTATGYTLREET